MLTAQEAQVRLQNAISEREIRVEKWVESKLPEFEKAILQAIAGTRDVAYHTIHVETTESCDSPSLFVDGLTSALRRANYIVSVNSSSTVGKTEYAFTVSWGKKSFR
jgi:hypothetical protein